MRPFFRWAGSKRHIVRRLAQFWSGKSARYIEPFAGSACLFFELIPQSAILGDLNWEIVATLRAVQRNACQVAQRLEQFPKGEEAYYRIRRIDPRTLDEVSVAARFLFLNARCFNGLYRTNLKGQFNVPYRPPEKRVRLNKTAIIDASQALQKALVIHADFEETSACARPGDFVYLDPPYIVSKRRVFSHYLPNSFGPRDLGRLASVLDSLDSIGAHFLITYADSREARGVLAKWNPRRLSTRRNIAGFAGHRRRSYELMATNVSDTEEHHAD